MSSEPVAIIVALVTALQAVNWAALSISSTAKGIVSCVLTALVIVARQLTTPTGKIPAPTVADPPIPSAPPVP